MVTENNRDDGDVKLFPKIIGIASLLKNDPSTSHRSENSPSPRSRLVFIALFFVITKRFKKKIYNKLCFPLPEEKKDIEKLDI